MPLLFIAFNTILLESPTSMSRTVATEKLEQRLAPSQFALERIRDLKKEAFGEAQDEGRKHRKKKLKGPNPLSCKKKKKKTNEEVNELKKKKKKRKKGKQPKLTLDNIGTNGDT